MPKRIMIIDDDDSVWFLYKYHFSLIPDIEIIAEFENAKDALLQIPLLKPEVVIADYTLPEMTGIELAEQLLLNPEIKVLLVTGHNIDYVNSELKGSRNFTVIHKDWSEQNLKRIIDFCRGD